MKLYTLAEVFAKVDPELPLFCDTETVGFYGKVRLFQTMQKGWEAPMLVEWPCLIDLAVNLTKHTTVWHNAHYDITTIQANFIENWRPEQDKIHDMLYLARLRWYYEDKFSLDDVLQYTLGYDPYQAKGLDKKTLQKSKWDAPVLSEAQLQYAATDVEHMPAAWDAISEFTTDMNYKLDMLTMWHALKFQWNGMPVCEERLADKYRENRRLINEAAVPINVNSWQQVRPYIGEDESDDEALARFSAEGNDRARAVRYVRGLRKQNSFLEKFDTDRIYGKFLPSARSGRFTSKDQNLQQIPRKLKSVFSAPPGRVFVYADFAQLELRTIAAIVGCVKMIELFKNGEDLHAFTAAMLFGEDFTPEHRQITKTYNFNLLYGGGVNMIITILLKQVGILQSEAKTNRDRVKWRNLWREITQWQEKGTSDWRKGRPGRTPMGRKYTAKRMTDQLNIENQGAGAEVAKLALHYLCQKLEDHPESILCNFIHDSYIVETDDDPEVYKAVADDMGASMKEAWSEMCKYFKVKDIPMPVEVKVGTNWGDIENGVCIYESNY